MKISIVISTYNRADSLIRTLTSVKKLAHEIIVIDNSSTDTTAETAKQFKAKVFTRPNNVMLNVNKNYGFTKVTGDWILCLDDDEVVPPELVDEIKKVITVPDVNGYWLPRKNIIFGRWIRHGLWWPDRQLRLFRKGSGRYPEKHVHEYLEVSGSLGTLQNAYVHYNYDSLNQYLDKMHRIYTESEVHKYQGAGYRISWRDAVRFPASDFMKIYFAQSGYKDGLHGLVLAMLQAFYSFVIFVKLWEREKFREIDIPPFNALEEMEKTGREMGYWVATTRIRQTTNPASRLWQQMLRKLKRVS